MSKAREISSFGKSADNFQYEKAIIYCRVSSDRQKIEGHGLESQEKRCRDYADSKGYQVSLERVFKDGYTGGGDFSKRPAMSALIEYIDERPYEKFVLIFDDLSRFARDTESHLKMRALFQSREVKLECLNYDFNDSPEGKFAETVLAASNELVKETNRRQSIQKQRARLMSGYWAFGGKKGYQIVKDKTHGKLAVPDEFEAPIMREAFEKFANGNFRRKVDVCRFLVEKKFWTKQKPERYIDKITDYLRDPFYAGFIHYPKWDVQMIEAKHQAIITLEIHEKIQKRLNSEEAGKRIRVDTSEDFPLRGLVLCSHCDNPLTAAWSKGTGGKYAYYFCQNTDCELKRKSIRKKDIEEDFVSLLKNYQMTHSTEKLISLVFDRVWGEEVADIKKQEIVLDRKCKDLEDKISQLTDLLINSNSPNLKKVYEEQIEVTHKELEEYRSYGSLKESNLEVPYRTALEKATGMLKSPYKVWVSLDAIEKQKLFFFIFDDKLKYAKNEGYRTNNLPCSVRLFEEFVQENSQDVEMVGVEPTSELM